MGFFIHQLLCKDVAVIPVTHELLSLNKQSNITQLLSIQELFQS